MLYLIIILLALFQATIVNVAALGNIRPDLLLILVVFIALYKGPLSAAAAGGLAGFLKDVLSTGIFLNTLTFALCGGLVGLFAQRFYRKNASADFLIVFVVSIVVSCVYLVWFSHWDYPPPVLMLVMRIGIPTILYTTLIAPLEFFILKKILD